MTLDEAIRRNPYDPKRGNEAAYCRYLRYHVEGWYQFGSTEVFGRWQKVRKQMKDVELVIKTSDVSTIAETIWSMDNDQQAFLLEQLAFKFSKVKMNGYMQLLAISESIKKRDVTGTVGGFIDDLHDYIGYDALTTDD